MELGNGHSEGFDLCDELLPANLYAGLPLFPAESHSAYHTLN